MTSQRDQQRVQFAPTPIVQDAAGFQIGQNWDQAAAALGQVGQQFQQLADVEARRSAELEAPEIIQRDGSQMLIAPSTFEPAGITTRAYRDKYRETAFAQYTHAAAMEFGNFVGETRTQFPNDPEAVNAKLDEKKNAMLSGLDPAVTPFMHMRFNAMTGQAVSQTAMAKRGEQMKVLEADAATSLEIYQASAAQVAGTAWKLEMTQEDVLANNALFSARWKETKALMEGAGWTKERIDKAFRETGVKIYIAGHAQQIRDTAINTGVNGVSAEGVQDLYNNIKTFADQAPPQYRAQVMQALEAEAGRAIAAANRQQAVFDQKETIADRKAQFDLELRRKTEMTAGLMSGPGMLPGRDMTSTLMAQFDREKYDVMMNPNISAQSAMRQVAMYDRAGATHMANSNEFYTQKMISMTAPLEDLNTTPDQIKYASRQLRQVLSDPDLETVLPVSVRAYGQRAVNSILMSEKKGHFDISMQMGTDGDLTPGQIDAFRQRAQDGYLLGENSPGFNRFLATPARMNAWADQSKKAFMEKTVAGATVERALQSAGRGDVPTPAEQAAVNKYHPFATSDGLTFDKGSEQHQADVASFFNKYQFVPPVAKEALEQTPLGSNPAATIDALGLHDKIAEVVALRVRGKELNGAMAKLIGVGPAVLMANLKKFGYDAAIKLHTTPKETGRNRGLNTDDTFNGIYAAIDKFGGEMAKDAKTQFVTLLDLGGAKNRHTALAGEVFEGAGQGFSLLGLFDPTPAATLKIDPALREHMASQADIILQSQGTHIDAQAGSLGMTRQEYATYMTMTMMKDKFDIKPLPDGTQELTYTTINKVIGNNLQIGRADDVTVSRYLEAAIRGMNDGKPAMVDFEPGSVSAKMEVNEYGQELWYISGRSNGNVVPLAELPINHPLFSGLASKVSQKVAEGLQRDKYGKSAPGTDPTNRELGWQAGWLNGLLFGESGNGIGGLALDAVGSVQDLWLNRSRRERILTQLKTITAVKEEPGLLGRTLRYATETEQEKADRKAGKPPPLPPGPTIPNPKDNPEQAAQKQERRLELARAADKLKKEDDAARLRSEQGIKN